MEDKVIEKQFMDRLNKQHLYNTVYSRLAEEERDRVCRKLVKEYLGETSQRSILEVGAGQGGNVPLIRSLGFHDGNIHLNELLPDRVAALKNNYSGCHIYPGNALSIPFQGQYDCVFQSTVFTSILNEGDRIRMADKMWSLLKPGGIILWYDFIYNNPRNKDVRKVSREEVIGLFSHARERKIVKVTLAPPIGRRVGSFYDLFNLPFLRSHILAVFKK